MKGRRANGWHQATALALALATGGAVALIGCGKTAQTTDESDDGGAEHGFPPSPPSSSSPFGGTASMGGGTMSEGGRSGSGGTPSNEQTPDDQTGIGSPLSPTQPTLLPAGCAGAIEDECETDEGEAGSRLMTSPVPLSILDATPTEQLFAACSTVYVQPRAGCVQPLGVVDGSVLRVAIVGDSYAVVQAGSIRVVDAKGIVRAAWHSPTWGKWSSRVPPVVASGRVIDFFVDDELLELDPRTGVTRLLALNPTEDVGDVVAVGDDLVWSVGRRIGGCIPGFEPTGVRRFVRESGEIVPEPVPGCRSLDPHDARISCSDGGLFALGNELYLPADPTTPVLTLAAPPFLLAAGSAYYQLPDQDQKRFSVYRVTPP